MTPTARVTAQAKVNLLLRVLAREVSGYHTIETIFLRLDLGDDVRVRVDAGRTLDCAGPAMPSGGLGPVEQNLAYRAAATYADATGWPNGFAIEIEKKIPVGGGLGGGSADAGAVLRALDALAPNPLGARLVELAAPLGADVPFMTLQSPMALAWGRGERMLVAPPLAAQPVLLAIPDFGVAASDAYSWLSADRPEHSPATRILRPESLASWASLAALAENDLEAAVGRRHGLIAELVDEIRAGGALIAMMSGSGSTVFGVFSAHGAFGARAAAPKVAEIPPRAGVTTILTSTSERVVRVELEQ
ncbi:MAG TPA: 4-(cytidine 5'-diphospho)-2-C-methyl-D-erythritol kinase [Gemmatimonadaceae bacterium]|nr:4-(cytidine 5'-diphospho)-2-C-methyl-D-erythritol kinase [Gemmatimonadaceae bacterium]